MIDLFNTYKDFSNDHLFLIWGIIVAIGYPIWIYCMTKFGGGTDWTSGEDFFYVAIAIPAMGAAVLFLWPIIVPAAIVIGLIVGFFQLNKRRILKKRDKDALSKR